MLPQLAMVMLSIQGIGAADPWPGFGGPQRDFVAASDRLSAAWPTEGLPPKWERSLGNGTSAIVVGSEGLVFTMASEGRQERVLALDAESGAVRWEHAYPVEYEAYDESYGGAHATAALAGDRLITVGIDAKIHALDRSSGAVLWSRDLVAEFRTDLPQSGYAASPLVYEDLVVLPGGGGPSPGAIALCLRDGSTAWARHAFLSSHASPALIRFGEQDHAVFHGINRLVGLDPRSGALLWQEWLREDAIDNAAFTPLWDEERSQILVSHPYDGVGTQAIALESVGGAFRSKIAWTNGRLKVEHGNGVLLDGVLYASDRSEPSFVVGMDLTTGKARFKARGIRKATFLSTGTRLLILGGDGTLYLAEPEERALKVVAESEALQENAWTVPTLVGRRLYLRDRFQIKAIDLPVAP